MGGARAHEREGKGGARRWLRADGCEAASRLQASRTSSRSSAEARSSRPLSEVRRGARRAGERYRHLRRGGHGEVASRRRVRTDGETAAGHVAFGECQPYGSNASYFVWREVWRRCSASTAPTAARQLVCSSPSSGDRPGARARVPLLPASSVSDPRQRPHGPFDAKLRKTSLEGLLAECLRRAGEELIVLVLEDCHWIDPLSRDLLEVLAGRLRGCACCSCSPTALARPGGGLGIQRLPQFEEVALAELDQPTRP